AVALMDRYMMPDAGDLSLSPVCIAEKPSPRLHHVFDMQEVKTEFYRQIEAIRPVRYFNRVILLTFVTSVLFFTMSVLVGIDTMLQGNEP
ncbi:MAG: hypothetical protein KJO15_08545, partial [Alphaproteobacteria bacterium]|nr:hypothetical protein [Alphaproteobacteria bacterium]